MYLSFLSEENQHAFLSCLADGDADPEAVAYRREWFETYSKRGYQARLLTLDDGSIVGKCHYIPIEYSPLIGKDMMVILCLYVHMYDQGIGDQRGKGYGRFMLREIEKDTRKKGYRGVAVWAMDMSWNPADFYRHMGYRESDREGKAVVLYKPFMQDLVPPRFLRVHDINRNRNRSDKVSVFVIDNAWCSGNGKRRMVREAIEGIGDMVEYREADCGCRYRHLHLGRLGGVFLDRKPFKPYREIGDPETLRAEIIRRYRKKNGMPS